ncbi:MAG: hypothetical protein PHE93_04755 [Clostridia bacterium]|nr:hypothetical protein [Clostridia bacterium]
MYGSGKHLKPMMKYLKSKGLPLFLLAIIPSILTSFIVSPSSMLYFLCDYFKIESFDFTSIYLKLVNFDSEFYYIGIIGVVLYVLVVAIMFGTVDRHMRVGEFTINFHRAKARLNYNLLTALKMTCVIVIVFELYNLLNVGFALLWVGTFVSKPTAFVFSVTIFVITSFALLVTYSSMLLWPPFMLHTGLTSVGAFKMGIRQNVGNIIRVGGVMLVPIIPIFVLMLLNGILGWGNLVRILLDGICLAILAVTYIVLMYTVFYDVTGTERLDLQNKNIWSRNKGV